MDGITDLHKLLSSLNPVLRTGDFVFVSSMTFELHDGWELEAIATFREDEGLTLVVPRENANRAGLAYGETYRLITLRVHSSLTAVGLTAAVTAALAQHHISANIIAGFFHDHLFVPASRAKEALRILDGLQKEARE